MIIHCSYLEQENLVRCIFIGGILNKNLVIIIVAIGLLFGKVASSYAYSPHKVHKHLTELSLAIYNRCRGGDSKYRDFEIRESIILGNIAMDEGKKAFRGRSRKLPHANRSMARAKRLINWHFYNPSLEHLSKQGWVDKSHTRLWKMLNREFTKSKNKGDKATVLGGILHLVEDLTVPAHVIPVYHGPVSVSYLGKFEHLVDYMENHHEKGMIKDRIDEIEPDKIALSYDLINDMDNICRLTNKNYSPDNIRYELANKTLALMNHAIEHCEGFEWRDFWIEAQGNRYFGQYNVDNGNPLFGEAGVLSKKSKSNSDMSCAFINNDKRYDDFVKKLHHDAIKSNIKLLSWASRAM